MLCILFLSYFIGMVNVDAAPRCSGATEVKGAGAGMVAGGGRDGVVWVEPL